MHILLEHKIKYLKRRILEIEELRESVQNNNFETAVGIGHKLKGNGETFGFPIISQIGLAIERAAETHDREKLSASIDELAAVVQENLGPIL